MTRHRRCVQPLLHTRTTATPRTTHAVVCATRRTSCSRTRTCSMRRCYRTTNSGRGSLATLRLWCWMKPTRTWGCLVRTWHWCCAVCCASQQRTALDPRWCAAPPPSPIRCSTSARSCPPVCLRTVGRWALRHPDGLCRVAGAATSQPTTCAKRAPSVPARGVTTVARANATVPMMVPCPVRVAILVDPSRRQRGSLGAFAWEPPLAALLVHIRAPWSVALEHMHTLAPLRVRKGGATL